MTGEVASQVFFRPLGGTTADDELLDLSKDIQALGRALELKPAVGGGNTAYWAMKVHLGPRNRRSAVAAGWARSVAGMLSGGTFAFDSLSITTEGLDEPVAHLALARDKGYLAADDDLPYVVIDGPDQGPSGAGLLPTDSALSGHTLAGGLASVDHLCVLTPVRPHPHVGLRGAVTTLGVGLADRAGKIALHRDIRPQVDTPLCAGCGVCMTVCLFDAITLNAGRAFIDHTKCTGCGECMNVCFMAGITPEEAAGIPAYQAKVADAAWSAVQQVAEGRSERQVYFNFLVRLDRQSGGARSRNRERLGNVGILASRDPVALDQATVDLISQRMEGRLGDWSGFQQLPGTLLARAEAIGLGQRAYSLVTV